jgi:hypothetical protein
MKSIKKTRSQFETRGFFILRKKLPGPERQQRLQGIVAPWTDISNRPGSPLFGKYTQAFHVW